MIGLGNRSDVRNVGWIKERLGVGRKHLSDETEWLGPKNRSRPGGDVKEGCDSRFVLRRSSLRVSPSTGQ